MGEGVLLGLVVVLQVIDRCSLALLPSCLSALDQDGEGVQLAAG